MSRNATATPPAPYFPQRTSTPTMRHASAPNVHQGHFSFRSHSHQPQPRRKVKPLPNSNSASFAQGEAENAESPGGKQPESVVPQSKSWIPNLGKMAKAAVNAGMTMGMFSGGGASEVAENRSDSLNEVEPDPCAVRFMPSGRYSQPPGEVLDSLRPEDRHRFEQEWLDAEHRRVTECARLCSQWPQSGYHIQKFGPMGARIAYEPQSSSNWGHVHAIMERQAALERHMAQHNLNFWPAAPPPDASACSSPPSDDDSEPTLTESSLPSPRSSLLLTPDEALAALTAAHLKAAMSSPLIRGVTPSSSQISLLSQPSPKASHLSHSLVDLDSMASSMALSSHELMEVDLESSCENVLTRPTRAQSCGAKRPLTTPAEGQIAEEEKRRKLDEGMVVEEALQTGVIIPAQRAQRSPRSDPIADRMTLSAPDLSHRSQTAQPAVFGHIVKTSDTHPIIISTLIPPELLPFVSRHLVFPESGATGLSDDGSRSPLLLSFAIDVSSLLLSHVPAQTRTTQLDGVKLVVPSASGLSNSVGSHQDRAIGNLMMSSCPGKRLRMDGPVKGRGPVYRDLKTDLRRIEEEGVGCLVCCLDDAELELLGVSWSSYRDAASDLGLDIVR